MRARRLLRQLPQQARDGATTTAVGHPLIQSYEPGEDWGCCYRDQIAFVLEGIPEHSHP